MSWTADGQLLQDDATGLFISAADGSNRRHLFGSSGIVSNAVGNMFRVKVHGFYRGSCPATIKYGWQTNREQTPDN